METTRYDRLEQLREIIDDDTLLREIVGALSEEKANEIFSFIEKNHDIDYGAKEEDLDYESD